MDVLGFDPAGDEAGSLGAVVGRRFDRSAVAGWRIVGVAVAAEDLGDGEELLLDGLVAGDVVIAGPEAATALVHCGDRLAEVRLPDPGSPWTK